MNHSFIIQKTPLTYYAIRNAESNSLLQETISPTVVQTCRAMNVLWNRLYFLNKEQPAWNDLSIYEIVAFSVTEKLFETNIKYTDKL